MYDSPYYSLHYRVEDAAYQHVTGLDITGLNVYQGISTGYKEAPCVVVAAERGEEIDVGTKVFNIPLVVEISHAAADSLVTGVANEVGTVFNAFYGGTGTAASFTGLNTGMACYDVMISSVDSLTNEDVWQNVLSLDVIAGTK